MKALFSSTARVALGFCLGIPFVFPRNNWDVDTASIFGNVRSFSVSLVTELCHLLFV